MEKKKVFERFYLRLNSLAGHILTARKFCDLSVLWKVVEYRYTIQS